MLINKEYVYMKITKCDITEQMKLDAVNNSPEGATEYHFNSKKYYTSICGLTCEYVHEISAFAVSMNTTLDDISLSFNNEVQPTLPVNDSGCCRSVENGVVGWFIVGRILFEAVKSHNEQVKL